VILYDVEPLLLAPDEAKTAKRGKPYGRKKI